jgi:hypothetical protein
MELRLGNGEFSPELEEMEHRMLIKILVTSRLHNRLHALRVNGLRAYGLVDAGGSRLAFHISVDRYLWPAVDLDWVASRDRCAWL